MTWKTLPYDHPTDGATCYVRLWWWIAPFEATWSETSQNWTDVSGLIMPWYVAPKWSAG